MAERADQDHWTLNKYHVLAQHIKLRHTSVFFLKNQVVFWGVCATQLYCLMSVIFFPCVSKITYIPVKSAVANSKILRPSYKLVNLYGDLQELKLSLPEPF